ncbi:ef hand domain-containing protein, partial [Cystoisospora suis]
MTRLGFLMRVNDRLLGQTPLERIGIEELKEHGGNPYAAPTPMFELFEAVHLTVFFLMIAYFATVAVLLAAAMAQSGRWFTLGYWTGVVPLAMLIASLAAYPKILSMFTIMTSVGYLVDDEALRRSTERQRRRKVARECQILNYLLHKAGLLFASRPGNLQPEVARAKRYYDSLPVEVQKGYQDVFHAFAVEKDVMRIPLTSMYHLTEALELDKRVPDCRQRTSEEHRGQFTVNSRLGNGRSCRRMDGSYGHRQNWCNVFPVYSGKLTRSCCGCISLLVTAPGQVILQLQREELLDMRDKDLEQQRLQYFEDCTDFPGLFKSQSSRSSTTQLADVPLTFVA